MRLLTAYCFLLTVPATSLLAQQPTLRDTLPSDSIRADTVDLTKRFLETEAKGNVRAPLFPSVGVDGPKPALSRIVLDRDSIDWTNAQTLGDLLMRVPGVYLWRGGFVGRPENPNYQGRGATAVEYYVDGLPYIPIGPDSVGVDPAVFALSQLQRVEIDRWPGLLQVRLFTRRTDRLAPASRIEITTGYQHFARYVGGVERRYASGIGFGLAADFMDSPTITGQSSHSRNANLWVQAGFLRPKFGFQYQLLITNPQRDPFIPAGDTAALGASLDGKRTDMQLRGFYGRPEGGTGGRIELLYGRSGWSGSGISNQVNQGGAVLSYRSTRLSASGSFFNRSRWTPFDIRASAGWSPPGPLTLSAEAGYQTHDLDRRSKWLGLRGGIRLPFAIDLSAAARLGSVVPAPALLATQAQQLKDLEGTIGWQTRPVGLELSYSRTAAFQPFAYQPYPSIPSFGPQPQTEWLTAHGRISPVRWISLDSWYSDPRGGGLPDGLPPTHSFSAATIRSKFWRTFPSGAFNFKVQIGVEAWGDGIIGRDSTGVPIKLRGQTFLRSLVELQILGLIIYWDRWNLASLRDGEYVPGFPQPIYAFAFGVKWEFTN